MKKFSVALSLILTFILCLPSFSVSADELVTNGFYTIDSVQNVFTGSYSGTNSDFNRSVGASDFYKLTNNDITAADIQAFNNLEVINVSDPNYCSFLVRDGSTWYYYILQFNSTQNLIVYNSNTFVFICPYGLETNQQINFRYYTYQNGSWSAAAGIQCQNTSNFRYFQIPANNASQTLSLLYTHNIDFVSDIGEYTASGGSSSGLNRFFDIWSTVYENNNNLDYTNYCPSNLPYWDGSQVVDPEGLTSESNLNHMYFNSCDIGFAEPYGVNNFATFGGAYFYVKYNVDDWILDHINDYDIYFSSTAYVGSRQYNGSKRVSLDQDGCITIPFSDIFTTDGGVVTNGFVSAVSSKVVDKRFYKSYLYSIAGEKLQDFIDQQNNVSGSFSNAWDQLVHTAKETYFFVFNGTNNFSEVIQDVVQSQVISLSNVYKNYKINVNLYLVDNDGNRSGSVGRMFDLYTGSDTSTDNQGLENENPYINNSDDYLPDLPDDTQQIIESIGNGSGVNVYNLTPSQIKLIIDNGFEKFVAWYNSDPSTAEVSTGFWNSFGIFRNNPAIDLYQEYFGFLPTAFKDIILGCATIGIVGGVFCAIRRKLT